MEIPQKLRTNIWSSYPISGYLSKKYEKIHPDVHSSFTVANIQKQPKCPSTDKWIKIRCGSYIRGLRGTDGENYATTWLDDKENFTEDDLREFMKGFAWMILPSEIEYTNFSGDNKIKIQYTAEDIEKNKDYHERRFPTRQCLT